MVDYSKNLRAGWKVCWVEFVHFLRVAVVICGTARCILVAVHVGYIEHLPNGVVVVVFQALKKMPRHGLHLVATGLANGQRSNCWLQVLVMQCAEKCVIVAALGYSIHNKIGY